MLEWATANPSDMLPIVRHGWEAYYEAWRDRVTNSGIIGALLFGFVAGLLFEPLEPVHTEGMWPRKTFAAIYTVVVAVSAISCLLSATTRPLQFPLLGLCCHQRLR